jgi:hypothetical protein
MSHMNCSRCRLGRRLASHTRTPVRPRECDDAWAQVRTGKLLVRARRPAGVAARAARCG